MKNGVMRYLLLAAVVALVAATALMLGGCNDAATGGDQASGISSSTDIDNAGGDTGATTVGEDGTELVNPVVSVTGPDDFSSDLGFSVDAPAEATDKEYTILNGNLAQVNFTEGEAVYILRASAPEANMAGIFGTVASTEEIQGTLADGSAVAIAVSVYEDSTMVAEWYVGELAYSLSTVAGISQDEFQATALQVAAGI